MKRKRSLGSHIVETLRREAAEIFEHAGSFLLREVCARLREVLRDAAERIVHLEEQNAKLARDLCTSEEECAELHKYIQMNEGQPPLEVGPPGGPEG